ncbi:MAG: hypothetical protein MJ229_01630 [bacterium]|nr:hypothetical protein [bacterium]
MKITAIRNLPQTTSFKGRNDTKLNDAIDKFSTGIKNNCDMNDTIAVPRTIFKGYMAFTISTTLGMFASVMAKKHPTAKTVTNVLANLVALAGTYCFVRPYLFNFDSKTNEAKENTQNK